MGKHKTLKLEFKNNIDHINEENCIMEDEKDFIIGAKDNQEELVTKKKQKVGIGKYCIFAGALVLFGTAASIKLNNNKYKDEISIESTSSSNSLDNIDNINGESEQLYGIVGYKPIYEEQVIYYEDENGKWEKCCQVLVDYEPIYGYISNSSMETEHSSKTK